MLADDHPIVRKGLVAFFATASDIEIIAVTESGRDLIEATANLNPDVILLDLFLQDKTAIEIIGKIRTINSNIKIIILTSHEGAEYLEPTIKAGALSYLLKDTSPEDLVHAVRKAIVGESVISPRIADAMVQMVQKSISSKSGEESLHEDLTERELEVLKCIADGMTNQQISKKLVISEKTVKTHVSSILRKLFLNDRTQAAVYAWRTGVVS